MTIKTTFSQKNNIRDAVTELKNNLANFDTKALLFFASSCYEPHGLSKNIQESFTTSQVFGCTTAGEITTGKMLKNSIVAMAFDNESLEDISLGVIENIKTPDNVTIPLKHFEQHYSKSIKDLDITKYVGIILIDGLSLSEEKIMDKLGDKTNLLFIGGSAGDDLKFKSTYVFANGKAYNNAAVLALLKPKNPFYILKTQSFCSKGIKLEATKVNSETRTVLEFNNKPAALAYAESLSTKVENAPNHFMVNPLGLMVDNDPFVRSPQVIEGNAIKFYCNVMEGMELEVMESTDMIKDTTKTIDDKIKEIGPISGLINFHCILRTLELEQKKLTVEYGNIFRNIPTIGFSTYGEEYLGHINQTSTILVFK